MTRIIRLGVAVCALAAANAQVMRTDGQARDIVELLRGEVSGDEALDYVLRVHETDRWFTFSRFRETHAYLNQTMKSIGLQDVETVGVPADGVTRFGHWTMPMAWDVTEARLEIAEPALPADVRVLANYRQTPASLIMWSGSTPAGGVAAGVVEVNAARLGKVAREEVAGKMVLTEFPPDLGLQGAFKAMLYRLGAAGIISYGTENPELVDGHAWINAWGDHGWAFTKTSSPLPGFSIAPRQAARLRNLLARGVKVQVRAVASTRYYAGEYPYTTSVIRGTEPGEEVLQLGHTSETGAQDNATGVAAMLESMAALNRLIESGRLPRPRRSIRILAMGEYYGTMAYIKTHPERMKRTIGAICMDTAAGPYDMAGTHFAFLMNPDVARSYQDALMVRVAENYYAPLGRRFARWAPYRPSTDSFLSDPLIGVPTLAVSGSSGVNTHHNSADTVDRVDPRSLRDLSAMVGAYLYYLASAGEKEIPWLAEIAATRATENIMRAAAPSFERLSTAVDGAVVGRELYAGLARISHSAERDEAALRSLVRLAPASAESAIAPSIRRVRVFAEGESRRLQETADRRAKEIGAPAAVHPVAPPADPRRAEAGRLIVRRKEPGPITLDDLPYEKREGFPGFGGSVPPLVLLTWCDGKRTVEEVIRRIELERGPMDFDFVSYYKFLARHGYIELLPVAP